MLKKSLLILCLLLFNLSSVNAQELYGENPEECKQKLTIMTAYYKQKAYTDAAPAFRQLLNQCPQASKNIYIIGSKIFEEFLDKEKDEQKIKSLTDTLLLLQDYRVLYFSPEDKNSFRAKKGTYLLKYRLKDEFSLAFAYLDSSFNENANDLSLYELQMFMYANNLMVRSKKRTCSALTADYLKVSQLLQEKTDQSAVSKVKSQIDSYAEICLDCSTLDSLFQSELKTRQQDSLWLDQSINLLTEKACNNSKTLLNLLELRFKTKETTKTAGILGSYYSSAKNYIKAEYYFDKAISLSDNSTESAQYLLEKAKLQFVKGEKTNAYNTCKLSINKSPNSEAYLLAGDIVASSSSSCSSLLFGGKELFWLACDYYSLASQTAKKETEKTEAQNKIRKYSIYFPEKSDLFLKSITEGSSYKIDCIFNDNTKVRSKAE